MLYCNANAQKRHASVGIIRRRHAPARGWLHLSRVLLCAALLVQCVFVQSHVHAAQPVGRAVAAQLHGADRAASVSTDSVNKAPEYCLQCWEAAIAGHYVAPNASLAPPPPPSMLWGTIAAMAQWSLRQPPRGWLGRAPPQ